MVAVIFKDLKFKENFEKVTKFIKNNRIFKYTSCIVLAFSAVIMTVAASGVTLGYNVSYSDEVIAVVSSQSDYKKADAIILEQMDDETAKEAAKDPKFAITLTVKDKLNNTDEIVDAIVENNEDIVKANAIIVNGNTLACVQGVGLNALLEKRLNEFNVAGAENKSEFVDDVKIQNGYYLTEDLVGINSAWGIIKELSVKTVSVVTSQVEIPFETKNVKTNEKTIGYSQVTTKGENGIAEKTEEIVKINGEVTSTTELSKKVVKEQVTQVVTVGTAINRVAATTRAKAASAGFICPVQKGQFTISAYYGDGRGHKGIDLAANKGTPIFAVASGTVTYAGYDSDFGYNVVIQHSNGIKTRYAHANALCVSVGNTVSQGDMIATVGNSGWSTGSHLHFEVIVNGTRVNPAPYIGF